MAGVLALSLLAGTVWGQVMASITGTVRDASGAVMPGATVTVKHTESGLVRAAETDSNGNYTVPSLPVGRYEVSTEKTGFKQAVRRGINLVGFQENHIFSPTLLNAVNFGYTRADALIATPPAVPIPAGLSFITGRVPGQITIGGGISTAAASSITPAFGNSPTRNVMNLFSAGDDVHFIKGNHSFSAGVWVQGVQQNLSGPAQNVAGTAAYPSLQALLTDSPTAFNANVLVTPEGFRSKEAAWYIQDEIKLRPNLTLRLGLRDEMTTGWNEVAGRCSNILYDPNGVPITEPLISHACLTENHAKALWQPRVGVAWDPTGTGTWAVRAGFGIYNDLQDTQGFRLASNPPYNGRLAFTNTSTNPVHLLSLIPIGPLTPLAPTCNPQLDAAKKPCSIYSEGGVDPTMRTPAVQQWSFAVERGITKDLVLQLGYVGSQAYHTLLPINLNAPRPQVCTNPTDPRGCLSGGVGVSAARPAVFVPPGTTYIPYIPPATPRPNPDMDKTNSQMFSGTSSYHALNVSVIKHAGHGLIFKTNYTFSKAMDYNSAGSSASGTNQPKSILNPFDRKLSKGIAAFSLQHQFNANFAYELPFGKGHRWGGGASGFVDRLIGGWQWNGIVTAQSGFPLTPQVGANTSGTGDTDNPDAPNWNPAFSGPVILGRPDQWFDRRAFVPPTSGTFGNVARGSIVGPGLTTLTPHCSRRSASMRGGVCNFGRRPSTFSITRTFWNRTRWCSRGTAIASRQGSSAAQPRPRARSSSR